MFRSASMILLSISMWFTASRAVDAVPLYFTTVNVTKVYEADTNGLVPPQPLFDDSISIDPGPVGIDVHKSTGDLFWGTGNNFQLWSAPPNAGSNGWSVVVSSASGPMHDAEVDESNNRVFFTEASRGVFEVPTSASNVPGPSLTPLYELAGVVTVEYVEQSDALYFGGPSLSAIFSGDADGTSSSALYTASGVRDIAIDRSGGTIYWVDHDNLWSAPLDGSGAPAMLFDGLFGGGKLRAVAFDDASESLFIGEFDVPTLNDMIWTADADGIGVPTPLYSGDFGSIRGIAIGVPEPASLVLVFAAVSVFIGARLRKAAAWRTRAARFV